VVDGKMPSTGIEELLKEYSVNVHEDRVLQASDEIPTPVIVQAVANHENPTPIAALFADPTRGTLVPFIFRRARTVDSGAPPMEGGSRYSVTPLMFAVAEYLWAEKELTVNVDAKAAQIKVDPAFRNK